jgi:hypothetical protein
VTTTEPKTANPLAQAPDLIRRSKEHLHDYREGSGSGLDSDACVHAAWHLRRDLTDLVSLLEELLTDTVRPVPLQAVPAPERAAA